MALPWNQWTCSGCGVTNTAGGAVEERYSLGIYAGRWCDCCWEKSGYRQEGPAGFDPADAGESYEPD